MKPHQFISCGHRPLYIYVLFLNTTGFRRLGQGPSRIKLGNEAIRLNKNANERLGWTIAYEPLNMSNLLNRSAPGKVFELMDHRPIDMAFRSCCFGEEHCKSAISLNKTATFLSQWILPPSPDTPDLLEEKTHIRSFLGYTFSTNST